MFSVIIPLYNKSAYISKAIESVINQSYGAFELIIINDGSTDDSSDMASQFSDKRIRLVNQPNTGVSSARNNGVKLAKYEYIAFLDADDWWDSNFLIEMKGLTEKYPDAGIYGSNFYIVKNGVKRLSTVGVDKDFKEGYIDYFKVYASTFCVPINCSFVVVPKSAFLVEQGFKNQLKFGEDFDLWIRIALRHKVAYLNKYLAYSNQDIDKSNRALGKDKLYPKESYFIFNLPYLEIYETQNEQLKRLMDGLRVRSLLRYYLSKIYINEVKELLLKVDFSNQPIYYRIIYRVPIPVINLYFKFMKIGSVLKQSLFKILPKSKLQAIKNLS